MNQNWPKTILTLALILLVAPGASFAFLTADMGDHGRLLRISGSRSGDRTGIFVHTTDLFGDPTPDLMVSSDFARDFDDDETVGRVDFFDGAQLLPIGLIDLQNPIPRPRLTLFGEEDNGAFGRRVVVADFDGDSVPDLAVSAPLFDSNDESQSGRIYLFFGEVPIPARGGATLFNFEGYLNAEDAHVKIDGAYRREQIGTQMTAADFDRDGRADLVVAGPNSQEDLPDEAGRVYVLHGRSNWLAAPNIKLIEAFDPATFPEFLTYDRQVRIIEGPHKFSRIGEALAVADLDGDGAKELLIGAPNENVVTQVGGNDATRLRPGRIHLFQPATLFPNPPTGTPLRLSEVRADFVFTGESEFDLFGKEILVADWNGDGVDDLWIDHPFWERFPVDPEDYEEDDEGLVSLFPGSSTLSLLERFPSGEAVYPIGHDIAIGGPSDDANNEALFGASMTHGDVFGPDGETELILGASRFRGPDGGEDQAGAVSIVTRSQMGGRTPEHPLELEYESEAMRIFGEEDLDRFGFQIASADLFPDAGQELIVGAPQADGRNSQSGVVYVFNPASLAFPYGTEPTPTYVETVTPIPTFTETPTETPTPSQTQTPTLTETSTPAPSIKFDLDQTGQIDFRDLWMFSTHWMEDESKTPAYKPVDLMEFLREYRPAN